MADTSSPGQTGTSSSRANLSLGLGIATIAGFILAVVVVGSDDEPGWVWFISPILGLGALAAGLAAREGGRFPIRAVIGMIIGVLSILNMIGWAIWG